MLRYLLAAIFLVALIGAIYNPAVSAQLPPGICVAELVTTGAGVTSYTCEARAKFNQPATPPFTGVACTPPANGIMLYAKLPDGSCLPIQAIAAPGFVAGVKCGTASGGRVVGVSECEQYWGSVVLARK